MDPTEDEHVAVASQLRAAESEPAQGIAAAAGLLAELHHGPPATMTERSGFHGVVRLSGAAVCIAPSRATTGERQPVLETGLVGEACVAARAQDADDDATGRAFRLVVHSLDPGDLAAVLGERFDAAANYRKRPWL